MKKTYNIIKNKLFYNKTKAHIETLSKIKPTKQAVDILNLLGGENNILVLSSCITRVRVSLKDTTNVDSVDEKKLKDLGILKIVKNGNFIHLVMGSISEKIVLEIESILVCGTKEPSELSLELLDAFGGKQNIIDVDACLTRLRVFVDNINLVDQNRILDLGAKNVYINPQSIHAVFGEQSESLKNDMIKLI